MTALRIFATARPSAQMTGLQPMSREDASFWALRRARQIKPHTNGKDAR